MKNQSAKLYRIAKNNKFIIAPNGKKVAYDDQRVVHVWPYISNTYMIPLVNSVYKKQGWKFRKGYYTTADLLQKAKKVVSGRECLSLNSMAGAIHKDVQQRNNPNEISLYYSLEQHGPCQLAAWPAVFETIARRHRFQNVAFTGHPTIRNNFIGQGDLFGTEVLTAVVLGDIFDEAEGALMCLANDRHSAIKQFDEETRKVVESASKHIVAVELALRRWAKNVSKIPLKASINEVPKVSIFGGGAVSLIHHPFKQFFLEQEVVPKISDFSEFILYLEAEWVMRNGFKNGRLHPYQQFKMTPIFSDFLKLKKGFKNSYDACHARMIVFAADRLIQRFRNIAKKSGLVFAEYTSIIKKVQEGHPLISYNTYCESITPVGSYLCQLQKNIFDGMLHISTFNCQPSITGQSIIRSIAFEQEIPFAGIEIETPTISTNQLRVLETLAVQAKRRFQHKKKNSSPLISETA